MLVTRAFFLPWAPRPRARAHRCNEIANVEPGPQRGLIILDESEQKNTLEHIQPQQINFNTSHLKSNLEFIKQVAGQLELLVWAANLPGPWSVLMGLSSSCLILALQAQPNLRFEASLKWKRLWATGQSGEGRIWPNSMIHSKTGYTRHILSPPSEKQVH